MDTHKPEQLEQVEQLTARVAKLERDLEAANENITRTDNAYLDKEKELEAAKAAAAVTDTALQNERSQAKKREKTINDTSQRLKNALEEIEVFDIRYDSLQKELGRTKEHLGMARDRSDALQKQYNGLAQDNAGIRDMRDAEIAKVVERDEVIAALRAELATHQEIMTELDEARAKNAAFEDQLAKFKIDNDRQPFDIRPGVYRVAKGPVTTPARPTLEDELAGLGGSGSSEDGSDGSGRSEISGDDEEEDAPGLEKPLPKPVIKHEDERVGAPSGPMRVVEVIRYLPFRTSAHNPILCWLQVELNFFILFSVWLSSFLGKLTSYIRPYAGTRATSPTPLPGSGQLNIPVDDFQVPAPDVLEVPDDTAGHRLVVQPPSTSSIIAERERRIRDATQALPPLVAVPDNRETLPGFPDQHRDPQGPVMMSIPGAGLNLVAAPVDKDYMVVKKPIIDAPVRAWYNKILSPLPDDIPDVWNTLGGVLFHLLVYGCIVLGIAAYFERQLWFDANDATRIYVLELLKPRRFQSGIDWILVALPEAWKRSIDIFIWTKLIERFDMQVAFQMPG